MSRLKTLETASLAVGGWYVGSDPGPGELVGVMFQLVASGPIPFEAAREHYLDEVTDIEFDYNLEPLWAVVVSTVSRIHAVIANQDDKFYVLERERA